ncbi:hypothetical protein L1887_50301 [Cichorium endivia]|nr:hypothetical protein L1887_50301 [Cichorium endivia]
MHGNAASILDLQMRRGQGLAAQTASRNAPHAAGGVSTGRTGKKTGQRSCTTATAIGTQPCGEGYTTIALDGENRARRVESVAQGRRGQSDGLVECMVNLQAAERAPQPRLTATPNRTPDVTCNFSLSLRS